MSKTRTAWALLAAAVSASTAHAAITFNLVGLSSLDPNAQAGFQAAANRWSSSLDVIQNNASVNVTLNIQVGFGPLASNVLAQTSSNSFTTGGSNPSYSSFKSALNTTSNSADDATAIAGLPSTGSTY